MTLRSLRTSPASQRLSAALIAVIILLLAALAGGTLGANRLLSNRAAALTGLKAQSQALDSEQTGLAAARKEVKQYAGLQQIAQTIVPADKDQAEAVREIVNIAAANDVPLTAITFPESTLGNSPASAAGGSPTPALSAPGAAAVNLNASTTRLSQLVPVKGIPGVYALQLTVEGDPNKPVRYNNLIGFLAALQNNRRTAQISTITLQPSTINPNLLTFTLTLNEYIKP